MEIEPSRQAAEERESRSQRTLNAGWAGYAESAVCVVGVMAILRLILILSGRKAGWEMFWMMLVLGLAAGIGWRMLSRAREELKGDLELAALSRRMFWAGLGGEVGVALMFMPVPAWARLGLAGFGLVLIWWGAASLHAYWPRVAWEGFSQEHVVRRKIWNGCYAGVDWAVIGMAGALIAGLLSKDAGVVLMMVSVGVGVAAYFCGLLVMVGAAGGKKG